MTETKFIEDTYKELEIGATYAWTEKEPRDYTLVITQDGKPVLIIPAGSTDGTCVVGEIGQHETVN